ncbi:hypothetical protein [Corynebacterium sp. HMSC14H10]|uniref:hypothetical protein n=1 Tax=Corynebacterium TaxID=1716 RepID=UPI0008A19126|nr:hypothetical protein [Corynebacterium sp. HMSC14H10]OFU62922.1 hypothetical protein HMPREF3135_02230 [Corynebacterium sp. HMSC14H10]
MSFSQISDEDFAEAIGSFNDDNMATLTVGPVTYTAPCAFIEYQVALINAALLSDAGFEFMEFGTHESGTTTVLVSSSTPVNAKWPEGYSPFEKPNKLLDSVAHTDLL